MFKPKDYPTIKNDGSLQSLVAAQEKNSSIQSASAKLIESMLIRQQLQGWEDILSSNRISSPVFVLGCVRSGTSPIRNALMKAGLPSWIEGHIFPLLRSIRLSIDNHFYKEDPHVGSNLSIDYFHQNLFENVIANYFERLHLKEFRTTQWLDKTPGPEMIEAAPYLKILWPQAKFIFCKRRGIENIESQLRRFKNQLTTKVDFQEACGVWARCMELWSESRSFLTGSFIEIDQYALATDPSLISLQLSEFLHLGELESKTLYKSLRDDHPEQNSESYSQKPLEETGWTPQQKDSFMMLCGNAMKLFGYTLGKELDNRISKTLFLLFSDDPEKIELCNTDQGYKQEEFGAFQLHPPSEGLRATLKYKKLNFNKHNRFYSRVELRNSESLPVIFTVTITSSANHQILATQKIILTANSSQDWSFDFKPIDCEVDVSLSTEMENKSANNFYAWAVWVGPRFILS